ncbi:MAG TPA: flagellar motor switch protein FliG [Gammaproteobacteria bacterium]|nr:flagellar motor switch protein FliG [Gammaproteobacteria bacterium]
MAEGTSSMSGADRAAILLMSLGESEAAEVLKLMGPKEVQKIGTVMATLSNVSRQQVTEVMDDFMSSVNDQTALGIGSEKYIKSMLVSALGEDKAMSMYDRVFTGRSSKGLEALKWMDPKAVAEIIKLEHPQIIAIVLAYLDSDQAADILTVLPERTQADILMRIAQLDGIQPQALKELDEIMEKQFSGNTNLQSSSVGGLKSTADILNFMDSSVEASLMESIREADNELGDEIQDLMFVFDNLADVDNAGIQSLLREVSSESLVLALKGTDDTIKEKIFSNMSKRAAEMLRDDLESRGPVKLSDVEAAQKEILAVARKLADSGDIVLGGSGTEQYI